jgi:hypothetical protein
VRANVVKAIFCFATADSTRKHARNSNKIVIFFKIIIVYCDGIYTAMMIRVAVAIL